MEGALYKWTNYLAGRRRGRGRGRLGAAGPAARRSLREGRRVPGSRGRRGLRAAGCQPGRGLCRTARGRPLPRAARCGCRIFPLHFMFAARSRAGVPTCG